MIPLVVLDIDGTIVGTGGQVQQCIWDAVDRATEVGVKVVACTGRPALGTSLKIAQRLGPNNPHVFQSGAHVGYPDGRTLKASALGSAATQRLIESSRRLGIVLELYTPNALFVERKTPLSEAHAKLLGVAPIVRDLEDVAAKEPVVRAQWVVSEGREHELAAHAPEGVQVSHATSPALPGVAFVSVTNEGVSKASAVVRLAEHLRIDLEDVMAVGDSGGDIPMLDVVGHPRVMANATDELLERYRNVVGDVEECGAAEALDEAMTWRRDVSEPG